MAQQEYVLRSGAPINLKPGGYVARQAQGQESSQYGGQYGPPPPGQKSYPESDASKGTSAALYNQRQAQKRAQAVVQQQMSPQNSPFPVGYGQ